MNKTLSRIGAALALATGLAAAPGAVAGERTSLVTVLTAADPQTQLMSMVLSMQALMAGAPVHVLLCGPAGDLALAEPPAGATAPQKPKGMSPQGLMRTIMAKGGTVEVCALYLPNRGVGPEALIAGVAAARPGPMAARLLADDTRIMSF
ncbi:hypothetical protein LNKW23_05290 [Paralimibaculum aggregatum]|uniref:Peroxiredoxin n=1 Tax=Paralimibaculum aggregatum TaxID=3036245 RepID=A0ABQ6LD86_9RHOB|nr:hypothetical protein [Limibaculum sp. NKW23]GMG81316.1 hypothetical protein LNKW23_05290 [Limibaculum sp. NKW23]